MFRQDFADKSSPWSIIYTDYDNITVLFRCKPVTELLIPQGDRKFFISVRSRSFNDLTIFGEAVAALMDQDVDLNDIRYVYNGPACKN